MALNYAEQWSPELLEILMQGTLTSPFVTSNVRWLDAKTFHFTQMSTSGYKNHNRKGGWNVGSYEQKDVPYTLTHDRDVEFMVDKADVDETSLFRVLNIPGNAITRTKQRQSSQLTRKWFRLPDPHYSREISARSFR